MNDKIWDMPSGDITDVKSYSEKEVDLSKVIEIDLTTTIKIKFSDGTTKIYAHHNETRTFLSTAEEFDLKAFHDAAYKGWDRARRFDE